MKSVKKRTLNRSVAISAATFKSLNEVMEAGRYGTIINTIDVMVSNELHRLGLGESEGLAAPSKRSYDTALAQRQGAAKADLAARAT